jgi:uncharacterized LabA/DUF88 family protein
MAEKVRVFIDFWNFQLLWNDHTQKRLLDWPKLPKVLVTEAMRLAGLTDYQYDGTRVYASVDMTTKEGGSLKNWLKSFLDRQAGINTYIRERRPRPKPVHCKSCDSIITDCPKCNQPFFRSGEKGVDAAIVTDMLSLAWANAYTVGVLVTSDADYVPAVENLQAKGFKIVNATWRNVGHELAQCCWVSLELDQLVAQLVRN